MLQRKYNTVTESDGAKSGAGGYYFRWGGQRGRSKASKTRRSRLRRSEQGTQVGASLRTSLGQEGDWCGWGKVLGGQGCANHLILAVVCLSGRQQMEALSGPLCQFLLSATRTLIQCVSSTMLGWAVEKQEEDRYMLSFLLSFSLFSFFRFILV